MLCLVVLVVLSVITAASAAPPPLPAITGTLIVLNKAEATASLIDLETGRVASTVKTGVGPHEVAVSPDGARALITNYGSREAPGSSVSLLTIRTGEVKTFEVGRRPHGVEFVGPDEAVVTTEGDKAVVSLDTAKGSKGATVATGQEVSHMVAVAPGARRAFVANIGSGSVSVVDLAKKVLVANVATGAGAEGIAVTPDGRRVWVTNRAADTLSVLDAANVQGVATIECKGFPIRVKVTPDGRHALVSNARAGDVAVFDTTTMREVRRIRTGVAPVPGQQRLLEFGDSPVPIGIVIAPDGSRAWVAHANADAVAVIDLKSWTAVGTLRAGREPDGMAYSPVKVTPPSP